MLISSPMKCPHCLFELKLLLEYDKGVDQCPKCKGIWLDKNILENIFDFTADDQKVQQVEDFQDIVNEDHENKLHNEYHYYKKPFKEMKSLTICLILNN